MAVEFNLLAIHGTVPFAKTAVHAACKESYVILRRRDIRSAQHALTKGTALANVLHNRTFSAKGYLYSG